MCIRDRVLTNGRYEFDWTDFEAKIRDCRMWMFCNPQNPEGRCFTEEELRKAGEICGKYGVWMLSDEIHGDIVYDGRKHIPCLLYTSESAIAVIGMVWKKGNRISVKQIGVVNMQ